jgi:hypothetical protein
MQDQIQSDLKAAMFAAAPYETNHAVFLIARGKWNTFSPAALFPSLWQVGGICKKK